MKYTVFLFLLLSAIVLHSCSCPENDMTTEHPADRYYDNTGRDDLLSGGVKMIPISTPAGEFRVWTKRTGNNPDIKLLLLHGGPGATHEYFECFDSFLPGAGIEYYYYDQLESAYSDQPGDTSLWTIGHYVEEVEQVRKALGLDSTNFFLLGHSWGGILAVEYALKYQEHMKGLIISNMMMSIPDYISYANDVLAPQLDPQVLARIRELEARGDYLMPEYTDLVSANYYPQHVLRMPLDKWPEPVNRSFDRTNYELYVAMQGPSEFGVVGNASLKDWDRKADLPGIYVPTLSIGAAFDTMDPEHMKWIATRVQNGRSLHCPRGSHMAMYDDQETYINGLIGFMIDVNRENFR